MKTHFADLALSPDQQKAIKEIAAFLESDQQVFILKGYAGTGKTTLLNGICKYLRAQQSDYSLLAPTGRAAMILSSKTNAEASTIHRGIFNMDKLFEKENGDSFKFYFKLKMNEDSQSFVYLIDEASMISDVYAEDEFFMFGSGHLLKDLSVFASAASTNRKIIFIGDDAQLPPVNMNFSPALDASYLEEKYGLKVQEVTLKQVVRQAKESGILENATTIRESLEVAVFNNFEINQSKDDVHKITPDQFLEHYLSVAKRDGVTETIVITHSNRQALQYNQQIRAFRYGDSEIELQRKDRLLITKNNYNGEIELFNGMFAEVIEVGGISYEANPRFKIEGGETIERKLVFRDVTVEVTLTNGNKHRLKTTLLDHFLTVFEGRLHAYDQRALYVDCKERLRKAGIKSGTSEFREALKNDLYFNALQAKYGYAITCHKSQGGEWRNTFIDFKVYMGKLSSSFFRWSYTAVTRSSKELVCIDAPDHNALSKYIVKDIEPISKVLKGSFYVPTENDKPLYFVDYRKNEIESLAKSLNISVSFISHNHQLETTFQKEEQKIKIQLWYNNNGFSKTTWLVNGDDDFNTLIKKLLIESILPGEVPFVPKFKFQESLHQYILDLLKEEDIPLTNIVQKEWSDQYFIYTGADCAVVEFYFDNDYVYTFAIPKSMAGAQDEKLKKLIKRLRGT